MQHRARFSILSLLLCTLMLLGASASAVSEPDNYATLSVETTEELVYEGEFTKALLRGINIADLRFTATRTPVASGDNSPEKSAPTLRLTMEATSKGLLRKIFGLYFHQRIESTIEVASFTLMQTNKLDEQGKRRRVSEAVFDRNAGRVVWTERDPNDPNRPPRVVTNSLNGAVQDIASAFYFLRTQPLALGQNFEMLISDSGQVYRTPVRVTERKKMKTVLGEVWTLRVEPEIFGEGRLLRGKGKMSIWYTDDERRVPVKAQINNELGRLDLKLKRAQKIGAALATR